MGNPDGTVDGLMIVKQGDVDRNLKSVVHYYSDSRNIIRAAMHRTAYSTYKLVGSRFDGANFPWFYTALQSPWYAKQFWGQDDIALALPDDLKTMVTRARNRIKYGIATIILWTIFALSVGDIAAHFQSGR
ncbi:hypothetical protein [Bradyrhizobium sp. CB2312]|uniref:hypothetical protein n=1 Tax=Bradyrhizobium sp. CB2312 TaxID=3039155 RepID=UPI0024B216C0|nr:hypothetical protein [Bradyrhizobium sp. CB2312]WFU70401.1 hypothetical protein QA642_34780 [Bradyrhizobium sp. CB2312]